MAARRLAVELVAGVLNARRPLDQLLLEQFAHPDIAALAARDRALARLVASTALRRQGEIEYVLRHFLERPLPSGTGGLWPVLVTGAAQILLLDMPAHAVVDLAVELTRRDRRAHRFAKLANAILRRVSELGQSVLAGQDRTRLNIPDWLWERWAAAYGPAVARKIAEASLIEAPVDITLKRADGDRSHWAERLGGRLLATGSIRLTSPGRIEDLPGYRDGEWWVQDAAAALIAPLAGDVRHRSIADLCAAPGGKTATLAAGGASVTAVDIAPARVARLRENLQRLRLAAEVVQADVTTWSPGRTFDVVVLDAPCAGTGTIRRHPDILRLKRPQDVAKMAELQRRILPRAGELTSPGGLLLYSVCSLEPEEGEMQVDAFLLKNPAFARVPVAAADIAADPAWITASGDLRTLPFHLALGPGDHPGMDGFYAARLRRSH